MESEKGKRFNGIQIGIPSLVVIFAVLCLVVFAVLSLMSALSEKHLQDRSMGVTFDYYEADALCEEHLAEIDEILISERAKAVSEHDYKERLNARIRSMYDSENDLISFSESINENLILHVEIKVLPRGSEKRYTLLKWQEENIADYEIDQSMPVWTGEF
ncbi:MAG: hypothetical protein K6F52_02665 [Clostridia bacterium]|nr:hypothetical protein [Clostridia bacterium]